MAPVRRYLRITKNSVLEVRIYLDKPSDAPWLLSKRDPVLERIMTEIRPKVLPKLREENENAKKKTGKKKRGIKDVVSQEDFEVVIFLKDLSSRHSLLTKQKAFTDKPRLKSTSNKLTGWLNKSASPILIEEDEMSPEALREEDDDGVIELQDIPEAKPHRERNASSEEADALSVSSDDEEAFESVSDRPSKRQKRATDKDGHQPDDKKKLALNTSYEGFSIYGRTLCLVVKRKGKKASTDNPNVKAGSEMMEHWVSTQAAREAGLDEYDDG